MTRDHALDGTVMLLIAIALWQAIGSWTGGVALSPPATTLAYLVGLLQTSLFWSNALATLQAFAIAFGLAATLGVTLGLVLGVRRFAGEVAEPILAGFYTIPKVTLYPVVLLVFGLGMPAKVAFGVMHGLVPATLLTIGAIRSLPPVLLRAARAMRLSPVQTVRSVLVPACLPQILAGLRLCFSLCFLGVLIGEMFSSQRGLGFLLVNGLAQNDIKLVTATVVVIVLFAILANTAFLRLAGKSVRS